MWYKQGVWGGKGFFEVTPLPHLGKLYHVYVCIIMICGWREAVILKWEFFSFKKGEDSSKVA